MNHKPYRSLSVIVLSAALAALAGCSTSAPLATYPPTYQQQKIYAVDHWDNIANDVAERVRKSLEARRDIINKPIYIMQGNDRPFGKVFYSLLRTRLVSKGLQVADRREPDCLILEYNVQAVLHETSSSWTPSLAGMGIGIANAATGSYSSRSDHEIIVNSSLLYRNRYVMQLSMPYYINDDEWPQYISPESFDPDAARTRHVRIIEKIPPRK